MICKLIKNWRVALLIFLGIAVIVNFVVEPSIDYLIKPDPGKTEDIPQIYQGKWEVDYGGLAYELLLSKNKLELRNIEEGVVFFNHCHSPSVHYSSYLKDYEMEKKYGNRFWYKHIFMLRQFVLPDNIWDTEFIIWRCLDNPNSFESSKYITTHKPRQFNPDVSPNVGPSLFGEMTLGKSPREYSGFPQPLFYGFVRK